MCVNYLLSTLPKITNSAGLCYHSNMLPPTQVIPMTRCTRSNKKKFEKTKKTSSKPRHSNHLGFAAIDSWYSVNERILLHEVMLLRQNRFCHVKHATLINPIVALANVHTHKVNFVSKRWSSASRLTNSAHK